MFTYAKYLHMQNISMCKIFQHEDFKDLKKKLKLQYVEHLSMLILKFNF